MTRTARQIAALVAAVAIIAAACGGANEQGALDAAESGAGRSAAPAIEQRQQQQQMTPAEYSVWCLEWILTADALENEGATVGEAIEFIENLIRDHENIADRVPEGARSGHDQVKDYLAVTVEIYAEIDRDATAADYQDEIDSAVRDLIGPRAFAAIGAHSLRWCLLGG